MIGGNGEYENDKGVDVTVICSCFLHHKTHPAKHP